MGPHAKPNNAELGANGYRANGTVLLVLEMSDSETQVDGCVCRHEESVVMTYSPGCCESE